MTGTLEATDLYYKIVKRWAKKSSIERNKKIDTLIDEILYSKLPYDIIEDKKYEAKVIAEMILRNDRS